MNDFMRSKIKRKNQLYKIYTKNGYKWNDHLGLQEGTILVFQIIAKRKEDDDNPIDSKLNNPRTSANPNPGCWDIYEKEGTSEKGCVEIEDWGFSLHFVLGFQENSIYTYFLS